MRLVGVLGPRSVSFEVAVVVLVAPDPNVCKQPTIGETLIGNERTKAGFNLEHVAISDAQRNVVGWRCPGNGKLRHALQLIEQSTEYGI
jgi:hypothetical protein